MCGSNSNSSLLGHNCNRRRRTMAPSGLAAIGVLETRLFRFTSTCVGEREKNVVTDDRVACNPKLSFLS